MNNSYLSSRFNFLKKIKSMRNSILFYFFLVLCFWNYSFAQTIVLTPHTYSRADQLSTKFANFKTYSLDIPAIQAELSKEKDNYYNVVFQNEKERLRFVFFEYDVFSSKYEGVWHSPGGTIKTPRNKSLRTFRGAMKEDQGATATLTIANQFFLMTYNYQGEEYILEQIPYAFNPNFEPIYILYKGSDVIQDNSPKLCGWEELQKHKHRVQQDEPKIKSRNPNCVEVEIGFASDYPFSTAHGGVSGTEAYMGALMSYTQSQWDDDFPVEMQYAVVGFFVPQDQLSDPFNGLTDIFAYWDAMAGVVNPTYLPPNDVATAWTNIFTSGIVGLSSFDGVCNANGVNICSEFTTGFDCLRQLLSHELGHNFNATHVGSPTIMFPSVNCSNSWDLSNVNQIMDYVSNAFCLSQCTGGLPIPVAEFTWNQTEFCGIGKIQFTDQSQYTTTWKWTFQGGTPSTSTNPNPLVTYNTTGDYEVTLEISNTRCKVIKKEVIHVEVLSAPIPDFGYTQEELVFSFINLTQHGESYLWKFGDGQTSTEFEPIHEYAKEGDYQIELQATNAACGTKIIRKNIELYYVPFADFEADTIFGCAPASIQFHDLSSPNVIRWDWDFIGGSPRYSSQKNPVVTYNNPGVYNVKLSVEGRRYGGTARKNMYIRIDSIPLSKFDVQISGSDAQFSDLSKYAGTYFWEFGDGATSNSSNPTHRYADGRYEAKLTVTNACGSTTSKQNIVIGNRPVAGFESNIQKACVPYQVQYNNKSTSAATDFLWTFPGGNPSSSTLKNPLVTYSTPGIYDVQLIAFNTLYRDTLTQQMYIHANAAAIPDFKTAVTGFTAMFSNLTQGSGTSYSWDFGDGKTSTDVNPSHNYGKEGEFQVKLTTENECGKKTIEKTVAIYLIPKVNFAVDTFRGCRPFTVQFYDQSSPDVIEWNWQFDGGKPASSTDKNPIIVYEKFGSYTVKLTVKNGNGTNNVTKLKFIQITPDVYCKYKRNPKIPNTDGLNTAQIIALEQEELQEFNVALYPNPADDHLSIETQGIKQAQVRVIDLTGRVVLQQIISNTKTELSTSELQSGTYLVEIQNDEHYFVQKINIMR